MIARPPQADSSELVKLMTEVRDALSEENHVSRCGISAATSSGLNSSVFPKLFGVSAKRRQEPNNDGTPYKRIRGRHTACTGSANGELVAIESSERSDETGKSLVASRFAPTTTVENVQSYIRTNLSLSNKSDEVSVRSLVLRGPQISELTFVSFKITASEECGFSLDSLPIRSDLHEKLSNSHRTLST